MTQSLHLALNLGAEVVQAAMRMDDELWVVGFWVAIG